MQDSDQVQIKKDSMPLWLLFILTHFWWLLLAVVIIDCEGALGSGYKCGLPIEDIAALHEISTIFVIPVFIPILFYVVFVKRKWQLNYSVPLVAALLMIAAFVVSITFVIPNI